MDLRHTKVDDRTTVASGVDLSFQVGEHQAKTTVVVHEGELFKQAGGALGAWMKRRYTEAAALARLKAATALGVLALLGGGLTFKAMGGTAAFTLKMVEFVIAPPGLTEALCGIGALGFVVSMDVYAGIRRRSDEMRLWDIARDPSTPPDVRKAALHQQANQ